MHHVVAVLDFGIRSPDLLPSGEYVI
jgi:hypothetical protein